jgi:hypothetical protein
MKFRIAVIIVTLPLIISPTAYAQHVCSKPLVPIGCGLLIVGTKDDGCPKYRLTCPDLGF